MSLGIDRFSLQMAIEQKLGSELGTESLLTVAFSFQEVGAGMAEENPKLSASQLTIGRYIPCSWARNYKLYLFAV